MSSKYMVRQLAHLKQKSISDSSCKAIIVDTLLAAESSLSEKDLLVEIQSMFQVLVTKERLREVLDELSKDRVIVINSKGYVDIVATKKAELLAAQSEELVIQEKAIEKWLDFIASQRTLDAELKRQLNVALPIFLRKLFIRHGVSSYELLSFAKSDFSLDIVEIADEVAKSFGIQNNTDVSALLPSIFQRINDEEINLYLIHCVKKAVGYLSEVISDENYSLIAKTLGQLTLYLDTNVLYRLLHLQGDERFESISETLGFCKKNNVKLKISAVTKKELSARLQYDAFVLNRHPVKTSLTSLGLAYRSSDNYVSTYWERSRETQLSVDDFNQYYQNHDIIFEAEGIETERITVDEEALIERAKELYSKLSNRDRRYRKIDATLWHDAYSLAYIEKMQKTDAKNAVDTGCLFLTTDQSIMSLQREDHELKNRQVIAIVPSQLLQMFAFTRPNEGYEETFIKFFASSSIGVSFDYSNEDIQEILSRISHYNTINPEVAKKILSRELVNSRYKNAGTEEEKEEIVYNDISEELLKELNITKEQLEKLTTEGATQTQELTKAKAIIAENKAQYNKNIAELKAEIKEANKKAKEEADARRKAEDEAKNERNKGKAQQEYLIEKKMRSWLRKKTCVLAIGIILLVCIIASTILTIKYSKNIGWLGILGLLGAEVYVILSGAKMFSPVERENVRQAFIEEYQREISNLTKT